MEPIPFYPGEPLGKNYPLESFLPPYSKGMVSGWLADHAAPGTWILDPFGSNPFLPLEAADAGYRVLVVCNNPILRLMLEVMAAAPGKADLQSILSLLGSVKRGDERLEVFIQSLYQANCPRCHRQIPAYSYTWKRDPLSQMKKVVRCPDCEEDSPTEIDDFDVQRLSLLGSPQLPKAWALQQLGSLSLEQEDIARESIDSYLARPLYLLFTLINRGLGLNLPPDKANLLRALLLSACYSGTSLWQEKGGRTRPRQLSIPSEFLEFNLWTKLEESISEWVVRDHPVKLVNYPDALNEPGICLVIGRLKSILPLDASKKIEAVFGSIPRPNQAFWTLSALWAGWLLGSDAVTSMLSALDRQHYDWYWHAHALRPIMSQVKSLETEGGFFAIQTEFTPGYSLAVQVAAAESGWSLNGLSFQSDEDILQHDFKNFASDSEGKEHSTSIKQEIIELMNLAGEPLEYNQLYMAALIYLQKSNLWKKDRENILTDYLSTVQADLMNALGDRNLFIALGKGTFDSPRTWTLIESDSLAIPLSERIENEVVQVLSKKPAITFASLYQIICKGLPGVIVPSINLVKAILASYGHLMNPEKGEYQLRQPDHPDQRQLEIQEIRLGLESAGRKLGFKVSTNDFLEWQDDHGTTKWLFCIVSSAHLSPLLNVSVYEGCEKVLVIPASRIDLIQFRRKYDMRIDEAIERIHVVKFHHMKELTALPDLNLSLWTSQLEAEPPRWEGSSQLPLLMHTED